MHVFLSYARSSEQQAACVEKVLREEGYIVWRDSELPAHLSYADVIEERLRTAKAVLVLWSAEAARSQWVRAEADAARELGTLIQSTVDGTIPPIPFNQIQCAELQGWSGEPDHPGWRKLHGSIVALAGQVEAALKPAKRRQPANSICVLPFHNMSSDSVPDYFTDGLCEDIITDLSKLTSLSVTPCKTALQLKDAQEDAAEIAAKFNVGYVLEGTVRRAGDRVRIAVQLIDARTGNPTWAERYYREFTDVFAVQDEMVQTIVSALKARFAAPERKAAEQTEPEGPAETLVEPVVTPRPAADETLGPAESAVAAAPAAGPRADPVPVPAFDASAFDPEPAPPPPSTAASEPVAIEPAFAPEPDTPPPAEEWIIYDQWDESEEDGGEWTSRGRRTRELAPRLVALAIALVLMAVVVRVLLWPGEPAPAAPPAPTHTYTITETVKVRSLPSRTNSRVLGTLESGRTINIVPELAGAQHDWLKIKDGPYIGGYVWRESTRPTSETGPPAEAGRR